MSELMVLSGLHHGMEAVHGKGSGRLCLCDNKIKLDQISFQDKGPP